MGYLFPYSHCNNMQRFANKTGFQVNILQRTESNQVNNLQILHVLVSTLSHQLIFYEASTLLAVYSVASSSKVCCTTAKHQFSS
jgi:hypothetical protein